MENIMNTYSDDAGVNTQITDLESIVERFIELFDETDGSAVLIADEDEVIDLLNDASIVLEREYEGAD